MNGHLVAHGSPYRLGDLDVPSLLDYIWWYFTKESDEAERTKFQARLWRPPSIDAPIPPQSPWSAESENAAFSALKAQTGS